MKKYKILHENSRSGFTMLELVFVIVVLGILVSLAIPRLERDLRQEAADNILSAIRYTQHLALNDNKTDPLDLGNDWQQRFWTITFTMGTNPYYIIGSDMDNSGGVNKAESAIDPQNGKYMHNASTARNSDESPNIFIGEKYTINSMSTSAACNQDIGFDHFGRPIKDVGSSTNNYSEYMTNDCNLTFNFTNAGINPLIISITKETGYASIIGQAEL